MDTLDKSLLFELAENCRVSFSKLSNLLNITQEEVSSRIQRLVKDRIILKFTVVPVGFVFGAKEALICFRSNQPFTHDQITLFGVNSSVEFISVKNTEGFAKVYYRTQDELIDVVSYFRRFHSNFEDIQAHPIHLLEREETRQLKKDLFAFQKIDWLILTHLREQGRLSLSDLSKRTNIAIETLVERLSFLRDNNLIRETIQMNPAKTQKETWTNFRLELTFLTQPMQNELNRELLETFGGYWWSYSWKVVDKPMLLLSFLCSSYTEVEKIQTWLSEIAGLKSIDSFMGGTTYYFKDFRDDFLEEKRSHQWFSPEKWVTRRET
ncbi:MAG: AsnC family transcriptional regulator [Candidatus Hodarchaeales archaeon]|jgi:DNA-binding Lrp family transcriptional regulator